MEIKKLKYLVMLKISILFFILFLLYSSSCSSHNIKKHNILSDTSVLKSDMETIINFGYRNYLNIKVLDTVASYIYDKFKESSDSVYFQEYKVNGRKYKNVICSINPEKTERIIIGAHYDVCGNQDGADDNASGVVGLLQLVKLIEKKKLNYRFDFVAYTLEEPPYFRSEYMGSYIHAKSLYENNIKVKGMICLEMIGYFRDEPNSQEYPLGILEWIYGDKGDFITLVQKYNDGDFSNDIVELIKQESIIKTEVFKGFTFVPGLDFSDHLNYWNFGYSAIMINNTGFYRNHNYHESTDKITTIDFKRLALTVDQLYLALLKLR
jgi:hypothetical protein